MNLELSDLARLVERQWRRFGRETPVESLLLTCAETPSGLIHSVYRPSFCLVVQGAKRTMLGDTPFRYAGRQFLLASVDVPVTARITEASVVRRDLALILAIDPSTVTDLVSEQAETLREGPGLTALGATDLDPALCDPPDRLLDLIDHPGDLTLILPLIRREIVGRLLGRALGPMLRQRSVSSMAIRRGSAARRLGSVTTMQSHSASLIWPPSRI
jgi:hypothetical protein